MPMSERAMESIGAAMVAIAVLVIVVSIARQRRRDQSGGYDAFSGSFDVDGAHAHHSGGGDHGGGSDGGGHH